MELSVSHKILLILLGNILVYTGFSQNKDYRAELEIKGRITGLLITPRHEICLITTSGICYYTHSIDSNWHEKEIQITNEQNKKINPTYHSIHFFNADTILIYGVGSPYCE